jgi:hypothetical protein
MHVNHLYFSDKWAVFLGPIYRPCYKSNLPCFLSAFEAEKWGLSIAGNYYALKKWSSCLPWRYFDLVRIINGSFYYIDLMCVRMEIKTTYHRFPISFDSKQEQLVH